MEMLCELVQEGLIITELRSKHKDEVLEEMGNLFGRAGIVNDLNQLLKTIKQREEIESTGIGEGVAIPHARSNAVKQLTVAFGRSEEGVEFESLDGKPVHLIFMIVAPDNVHREYLQAVAKIARLLRIRDLKQRLRQAKSEEEVLGVIREFDTRHPHKVTVQTKEGRAIYGR